MALVPLMFLLCCSYLALILEKSRRGVKSDSRELALFQVFKDILSEEWLELFPSKHE